MGKKCVAYCRVSSVAQLDGLSLAFQETEIRRYCETNGLGDPLFFKDEAMSGVRSDRPGFNALVELCKSGEVATLLVYDISRAGRNARSVLAMFEDVIEPQKIRFISLKQNIDSSTSSGKAFLGMLCIWAEFERNMLRERVLSAFAHKRSLGERLSGVTPQYGYEVGEDGVKLTVVKSEFDTILKMASLRSRGLSYRKVANELNRAGIPTKQKSRAGWSAKMVRTILLRNAIEGESDDVTNAGIGSNDE